MKNHAKTRLRVLIVEDSDDDAVLVTRALHKVGFDPVPERVDSRDTMARALSSGPWDVVISDHSMPGFSAMAALELARQHDSDLPFIVVSGVIDEGTAVAVMKAGAHDYLRKDNLARLGAAVERELREARMRRAKREAEKALEKSAADLKAQQEALTQKNAALREILAQIEAEKDAIRQHVVRNAEKLLLPLVRRLRNKPSGTINAAHFNMLEHAIRELTTEFGAKPGNAVATLTPRQMELCHLIRGGMSNKEIGTMLGVSVRTVETHRNIIRRKLGIARKGVHLSSHLDTIL